MTAGYLALGWTGQADEHLCSSKETHVHAIDDLKPDTYGHRFGEGQTRFFLCWENELSDQLARKESVLAAVEKLVQWFKEKLTFLKE